MAFFSKNRSSKKSESWYESEIRKEAEKGFMELEEASKGMKSVEKTKDEKALSEMVLDATAEEIHNDFYSATEVELSNRKPDDDSFDEIKASYERVCKVRELGFTNSKTVEQLSEDFYKMRRYELLRDIHAHFSFKYPQYKFIHRDGIIELCKKYGLVLGKVRHYIGEIPEKNMEDLVNMHISEQDEEWEVAESVFYSSGSSHTYTYERLSKDNVNDKLKKLQGEYKHPGDRHTYDARKRSLLIAAPLGDFDRSKVEPGPGIELIEIPQDDPIVFAPVIHEDQTGYLIITAWGKEASDGMVVNERMN